jgi:predicted nucleotidyltransferase
MVPVIEAKKEELFALCRKYNVRKLELFGSAARGAFDPESSDLDFLVEYERVGNGSRADSYFGLLFGLEDLFGRGIDLVVTSAISNPYFLRTIAKDRTVLYAA